jgi:hypothetical protein
MILDILADGSFVFSYDKGMELMEYFINERKREITHLTLHKGKVSFKVGGINDTP